MGKNAPIRLFLCGADNTILETESTANYFCVYICCLTEKKDFMKEQNHFTSIQCTIVRQADLESIGMVTSVDQSPFAFSSQTFIQYCLVRTTKEHSK